MTPGKTHYAPLNYNLYNSIRLLTWPTEAAMPVYMDLKLMVTSINQQVNIVQSASGRWTLDSSAGTLLWIYRRLIGRSYIALARQDQYIGNISDSLGRLRS